MWIDRGLVLVSLFGVLICCWFVCLGFLTGPCLPRALSHSGSDFSFHYFPHPQFLHPLLLWLGDNLVQHKKEQQMDSPDPQRIWITHASICWLFLFWFSRPADYSQSIYCVMFWFFFNLSGFLLIKMSYCTSSNANQSWRI